MILVIADTSGLLAALDLTHPDRDAARLVLDDAGVVIVSPLLLSELTTSPVVSWAATPRVGASMTFDDGQGPAGLSFPR